MGGDEEVKRWRQDLNALFCQFFVSGKVDNFFCFLEVCGMWKLKSMICYIMPADQEKTSTPHFDLVMRMIMVTKTMLIKITP